jgi:hypothetical protein
MEKVAEVEAAVMAVARGAQAVTRGGLGEALSCFNSETSLLLEARNLETFWIMSKRISNTWWQTILEKNLL